MKISEEFETLSYLIPLLFKHKFCLRIIDYDEHYELYPVASHANAGIKLTHRALIHYGDDCILTAGDLHWIVCWIEGYVYAKRRL